MDHFKCSQEIMTLLQKKWMAGNDVIIQQTPFNICMPEIKYVSKLLFMISPCYNFCSAKTQQILKNAWMQCTFITKSGLSSYGCLQLKLRISFENRDDNKCLFQRNTVYYITPSGVLKQ